jgi:hypothetical protein
MFRLYGMNTGGLFYRILFFLLISLTTSGLAQSSSVNYWNALADVTFVSKQVDGYEIELPKFGNQAIALRGKKISVKGYLIPLTESGDAKKYMFSSLPFNSCFFCGSAGPETVIELLLKQKVKFSENAIVVEGVLILNDKDIDRHMYILKDASIKN